MAKVEDVAIFFIDYFNSLEEGSITNLQLNKLLYFAQGHYLARTGKPLFEDDIEAWEYGPVVPSIYHKYKKYGNALITETISKEEYEDSLDRETEEEIEVMNEVIKEYEPYSASQLVSITHKKSSPWEKVYDKQKKHTKIDNECIQRFFKNVPELDRFDEGIRKIPVVTELPKEWYDQDEDEMCEQYDK